MPGQQKIDEHEQDQHETDRLLPQGAASVLSYRPGLPPFF
jgi:hypothetical protein